MLNSVIVPILTKVSMSYGSPSGRSESKNMNRRLSVSKILIVAVEGEREHVVVGVLPGVGILLLQTFGRRIMPLALRYLFDMLIRHKGFPAR